MEALVEANDDIIQLNQKELFYKQKDLWFIILRRIATERKSGPKFNATGTINTLGKLKDGHWENALRELFDECKVALVEAKAN